MRHGINSKNKLIHYYFNYSGQPVSLQYNYKAGTELISGKKVNAEEKLTINAWDMSIIEEN